MPSPLAHGAIALVLWPILRNGRRRPSRPGRRALLGGMLMLGLLGPDIDIAVGMAVGEDAFALHGGAWHSIAAGAIFACLFAIVCRRLTSLKGGALWLVGATAWWSHILLDACTTGRGVMLLWPLSTQRIGLPVPLFYGVRHSEPYAWSHHLITLATELPFVALMLLLGTWWADRAVSSSRRYSDPPLAELQHP